MKLSNDKSRQQPKSPPGRIVEIDITKGMAGFLNLTEIGSLAHSSENLLDLARKGQLVLAGDISDIVFESVDMLKAMLASLQESLEAGRPVPCQTGLPSMLEALKDASEGRTPAPSLNTAKARENDKKLDEIVEDKTEAKK